jgi:hypothetical protein
VCWEQQAPTLPLEQRLPQFLQELETLFPPTKLHFYYQVCWLNKQQLTNQSKPNFKGNSNKKVSKY